MGLHSGNTVSKHGQGGAGGFLTGLHRECVREGANWDFPKCRGGGEGVKV